MVRQAIEDAARWIETLTSRNRQASAGDVGARYLRFGERRETEAHGAGERRILTPLDNFHCSKLKKSPRRLQVSASVPPRGWRGSRGPAPYSRARAFGSRPGFLCSGAKCGSALVIRRSLAHLISAALKNAFRCDNVPLPSVCIITTRSGGCSSDDGIRLFCV